MEIIPQPFPVTQDYLCPTALPACPVQDLGAEPYFILALSLRPYALCLPMLLLRLG